MINNRLVWGRLYGLFHRFALCLAANSRALSLLTQYQDMCWTAI